MRQVAAGLGFGALLLLVGCSTWKNTHNNNRDFAAGGPPLPANLTAPQVVNYLNQNAARVAGFESRDVALDVKSPEFAGGATGLMVVQKPRNFRLVAKVLGNTEVDLGSNNQEFWYWVARAKPAPYVWHCSYEDLQRGSVKYMPFPFQPDWIVQALGMAEYDPSRQYELRTTKQGMELIEPGVSPRGEPIYKVTVLSRAQPGRLQVAAHKLLDARGQEICVARITDVRQDRATGAVIPYQVHMVWHQDKTELKLTLGSPRVGPIEPQQAARLFSRELLNNYPSFDLARGPDHSASPSSSIRQVRGQSR